MKLFVKSGKEYVLGGKIYRGGQQVEVPDKFARVLTSDKGPLQAARPKREVMQAAPRAQEGTGAPLEQSAGRYSTRVMTAKE